MDEELAGVDKKLLVIVTDQVTSADLETARRKLKHKMCCRKCGRLFMDVWQLSQHKDICPEKGE